MAEYKRYAIYEAPSSDVDILHVPSTLDIDVELIKQFPKPDHVVMEMPVHVIVKINKHKDKIGWIVLQPYDAVRLFHLDIIQKRWNEWTSFPTSPFQDRLHMELMNASIEPKFKGVYFSMSGLADCFGLYAGDYFRKRAGSIWRTLEAPQPTTLP